MPRLPPAPPPPGGPRSPAPPAAARRASPPRRRLRGSFKGILLGCAVALVCAAAGTAVAVLDEVHTLRDALSVNGSLKVGNGYLAPAGWGDPQTLLLVGDDQRSLTKYYHVAVPHLANEMLLVRLDPSKPYISMMSIPRELWVHDPSPRRACRTSTGSTRPTRTASRRCFRRSSRTSASRSTTSW